MKQNNTPEKKVFYKTWQFWLTGVAVVILTIVMCALTAYQIHSNNLANSKFGEIFTRLAEYEESHVPLEEVKVEIPSKKKHLNMNNEFTANISFSYSGDKAATYFVEWDVVNSENNKDNVAPLGEDSVSSISSIKKEDGTKYEKKNYKFLEADTYTISVIFYYFIGPDEELGSNEKEMKNTLQYGNLSNLKSRSVSFEVET